MSKIAIFLRFLDSAGREYNQTKTFLVMQGTTVKDILLNQGYIRPCSTNTIVVRGREIGIDTPINEPTTIELKTRLDAEHLVPFVGLTRLHLGMPGNVGSQFTKEFGLTAT